MGTNAAVILYPEGAPPSDMEPESICKNVFQRFGDAGLILPTNINEILEIEPMAGWSKKIWERVLPGESYTLEAKYLNPKIESLVFTQTVKEFWEGVREFPGTGEDPASLALPSITSIVTTEAFPIRNGYEDNIICETWAVVWFDFGDCRLNPEIHKIRDEEHPLFDKLDSIFGSPVAWGVFPH